MHHLMQYFLFFQNKFIINVEFNVTCKTQTDINVQCTSVIQCIQFFSLFLALFWHLMCVQPSICPVRFRSVCPSLLEIIFRVVHYHHNRSPKQPDSIHTVSPHISHSALLRGIKQGETFCSDRLQLGQAWQDK